MRTSIIGIALSFSLLTGCAYNPQQASIDPSVTVPASNEGAGVTVALRVVDERPSKSIGNRGAAFGKAAKITAEQDVAAVVQNKITEGLKNRGFNVAAYDETASPRLSVEIRALEYSTSIGFWTGGVEIQSAMKAHGIRDGRGYEKIYRSDNEKRVVIVPTAGKNEEWINTALTDVLTQFFEDIGLFRHLTGG